MYACVLCALFVLAEAAWPRNAALSFGKGFAVMLQGAWLIRIADIMWTGALLKSPPGGSPWQQQPLLHFRRSHGSGSRYAG